MQHNERDCTHTIRLFAILIVTALSILSIFLIPEYSRPEPVIQFSDIPDRFRPGMEYNLSVTLTNPGNGRGNGRGDEREGYYYNILKTGYFYNVYSPGSEAEGTRAGQIKESEMQVAEINTSDWKEYRFPLNNRPGLYRVLFYHLNYRYNKTLGKGRDLQIREITFHPNVTVKAEFLEGGGILYGDRVGIFDRRDPASVLVFLPENATLSVISRGRDIDGWPKIGIYLEAVDTGNTKKERRARPLPRLDISTPLVAGVPENISEGEIALDSGENISIDGHFNTDDYDYIKITANIFYDAVGIKTSEYYIPNYKIPVQMMIKSLLLKTLKREPDIMELAYLESRFVSHPILQEEDIEKEIRTFEQNSAQVTVSEMTGGSRYADKDIRMLTKNGDISAMLAAPGERIVIDILAKGTFVKGWPHIVVRLDGVKIGEADIDSENWKRYRFYGKIVPDAVSFKPQLNLTISFTNSYYDRNSRENRTLYIKKVLYTKEIDPTIINIKDHPASVTPGRNYRFSFEIKNPTDEPMYYVYEVIRTGHLKNPSVRARAVYEIPVDSDRWKEFGIRTNKPAGVYRIGIEFINDLYDGEREIDRNLYVREVVIGQDVTVKPEDMNGSASFKDVVEFYSNEKAYFTAVVRENNASIKIVARGKFEDGWPIMRISIDPIKYQDIKYQDIFDKQKTGEGTVILDSGSTATIVEDFNLSERYDYANITVSLVSSSLGWKTTGFHVSNSRP